MMIWTTVHGCRSVEFVDHNPDNSNTVTIRIKRGDEEKIEITLFGLPIEVTDALARSELWISKPREGENHGES